MSDQLANQETMSDFLAPGDVVADKYRVEKVIGSGGMGIVVQAFHLHFEERVAIKFLLPQMGANEEALARFEREARAAFKIKSEHVTRVIDVGKLDGVPYMVMEYLQGKDLADLLHERRALPIEEAIELMMQTCEAVAEAHALGIVHRDLKPENLYLTHRSDGTPSIKVLDFGLSKIKATEGSGRERTLTSASQPMGTPQYMSPEQWMSSGDVGPSTDIWAMGVLLYELLSGDQPFAQEQLAQLCSMVLHREPVPLHEKVQVPKALSDAVWRCLRKQPDERFATVAELAQAIYPFGPPRLKSTVKRIAGIFRRAGFDVAAMPSSDAPPAPRAESRASASPARQRYDSDTQIIPEANDASAQPLVADQSNTWPSMPDPSGQASISNSGEHAPPGTLSGEHTPPPGMLSGEHLPPPGLASGEWSAPRLDSPATHPMPQLGSGEHPMVYPRAARSVTAQSWLHNLDGERPRTGNRRLALAVAVAIAAVGLVALVAIFSYAPGPETAVSGAVSGEAETEPSPAAEGSSGPESTTDEPTSEAGAEPSAEPAQASASASASTSASASAAPSVTARAPVPRAPRPRRPVIRSKGPDPDTMFGHR